MTTSTRILRLLSLLQSHRFWAGAELAQRLEVSPRTLRRDIDRLRGLGYAIEAARGVAGGYQLRGADAMPPLMLDDDEAVAVAVGLTSGAAGAVLGYEEASVQALTKVIAMMPARLRGRMEAVQSQTDWGPRYEPPIDAATLATLAQACRDRERARFDYVAGDGRETRRRVEPHRLVCLGRRWYLVAYDLDRDDWRTFRVDRARTAVGTGAAFAPRRVPGGDAVAFVQGAVSHRNAEPSVRVRLYCAAEVVEAFVGRWGQVEADPQVPEACVVSMRVAEPHWVVLVLAAIDAPFDVLHPPELVGQIRQVASRLLRGVTSRDASSSSR